ncbi:hypothetical protein NQ315_001174 [Exocentrus adspersus]|uniref:Chitin-binding type-2 domain-containing protein n=1 Tax=Exocentrus adspersus TaxID=1586481 RepID=A0AAV8WEM3_9CUCU|nr:hypothetical protein NQ315_001174 [Exocentrus adspersus]
MRVVTTILGAVALLAIVTNADDPWTPSPLCPFPSEELTRFPYEGDCSKYWECYEGARYPMNCPGSLEFNEEKSRCDDPTVANCNPDVTIIYPTFPHTSLPTKTTSGPNPECPFPSDEMTYFPVSSNCSQYWECYQGSRYLMTCPTGQYWSVDHNYCDFQENVNCSLNNATTTTPIPTTTPGDTTSTSPGSTTTPSGNLTTTTTTNGGDTTTTTTTGPWTPDPLCPWPSGNLTFFPDPTNCSRYYECYEGNKYLMSCPSNLYWNELASVCDYLDNVECNNRNPVCIGKPDGTYLPHPWECNKFYECVDQRPKETVCPGDLLWNEAILSCDYPTHTICQTSSSTSTTTTSVTIIYPTFPHSPLPTTLGPGPAPDCPFPSDELTFFPVVNNCSQYWECYQGNKYLMTCPSEKYWNVLHNYCDFPDNVDCSLNNATTTTPIPSTTDETTASPTTTTTTTVATTVTDTTTTAGTTTTANITTTTDTTDTTTGWTPDPQCPWPVDYMTFFPHPTDCSLYYMCDRGNKFVMSCPIGLYWHNEDHSCAPKDKVDCSDRTPSTETTQPATTEPTTETTSTATSASTDEGTTGTTEAPTSSTVLTTETSPPLTTAPNTICEGLPDGTYLPHPWDCSKFYECADGVGKEVKCPGDTLWNEEILTCDHPNNTICQTSFSVTPTTAATVHVLF